MISNKMGMTGGGDTADNWHVDGSDDEMYDPSKSGTGLWEPSAEDILSLFDKLEKDKVLELKWVCPGRRPPKSEQEQDDTDATQDPNAEEEAEEMEEEIKPQQPTEFDFDDDEFDTATKVTPRRTPGSKTPKSQKKVARMDKVLQHIFIERKQIAAEKEKRRLAFNRSPRGQTGSTKMKMSPASGGIRHSLSPGTSPVQGRSGMSPGSASQSPVTTTTSTPGKSGLMTTPVRPPQGDGGTSAIPQPQNLSVAITTATTNYNSSAVSPMEPRSEYAHMVTTNPSDTLTSDGGAS